MRRGSEQTKLRAVEAGGSAIVAERSSLGDSLLWAQKPEGGGGEGGFGFHGLGLDFRVTVSFGRRSSALQHQRQISKDNVTIK